ncbi:hypothetical protein MG293_001619 [Ovis ammon polii]|uniref:Uncharacterized protein n=1 Tax=Ovis ammon polii TaxID=230172 RepID=A0AAD4URJ9_OVIAM|nr:hypothetical protein MG293_001619 [Ovis ammon polii]
MVMIKALEWIREAHKAFKTDLKEIKNLRGFPGGSDSKESACNAGDLEVDYYGRKHRFTDSDENASPMLGPSRPLGNGTSLQYSCLENPMDRGAWKAAVHGVTEGRTRLNGFTFTFHFHVLEKEMATHSSVLAWRIPGTGEPGGPLSLGSHSRTRLKRLSSSSSRK